MKLPAVLPSWFPHPATLSSGMMDHLSPNRTIHEQTLSRADVEALAASGQPHTLIDCDLEEADLSALDLSGWVFERCTVRRTNFTEARLDGSAWLSCRGALCDFTGAHLTEARFQSSDFNNAALRRARLGSAVFRSCKLTGADFTDARALDAAFEETLLINARLPSFSFRKQTLRRVDFSQADLRKCDFRQTVFEECSLREASLGGCRFDGADLRGADLGGLRLVDAGLFRGATISREQAGQLLAELGLNVR